MSEVELVTEILMGVSALGVLVVIVWQYRKITRKISWAKDTARDKKMTERGS